MCRWCKIFQGSDVSTSGKVISRVYDTSGNIVSENIPLELVANEKLNNAAIKAIGSAHTTVDLRDGELVTAVIYDDNGHVVSKRQLLVENTAFIRPTDANARYIVGISMRSPFISSADPKTIRYPLNVPLEGLNLTGVVHFSNGDTAEYPVDGTRFKLMGFDEYVATQVGQTLYPVLKYALGQNEFNYVGMVGGDGHIAEYYTAVTLKADGTYGVKLYPSLVWVDPIVGYRLKWWLYNLNRDIVYDVTSYVRINASYSAYDPVAYGVLQRLSVSINLRDVNPTYRSYVHTQTVSIVIERQGTERTTNWTLGYTPDQSPRYGVDVFMATQKLAANNFKLRVDCKQTTQAAWLAKLYYSTKPLFDPSKELGPLEPTHFAIVIGATRTEYALSDWNATLTWVQNVPDYSTAHIQFIRKSGGVDLNLAVAGLPVYYVDQNWVAVV
jgi:hypothetical protein